MGLLDIFGKKVMMGCNCGCGCREPFEKYGRRAMEYYTYTTQHELGKPWKADYEVCIDCNLDQHTNAKGPSEVTKAGEKFSTKTNARKKFSTDTEATTYLKQSGKCNDCKKKIGVVNGRPVHLDYDHIDGDPSNNHPSNCQALCLDCHRNKSVREKRK